MEGQPSSKYHGMFRWLMIYFVLVAAAWTLLDLTATGVFHNKDGTLRFSPVNQLGSGFMAQHFVTVCVLMLLYYSSSQQSFPGISSCTAATLMVVLVWWLQSFMYIYNALSGSRSFWATWHTGCDMDDKAEVLCRVSRGVAILDIMLGAGLCYMLYVAQKRAAEIELTAEKGIVTSKLVPNSALICSWLSIIGLIILIGAQIRIVSKSTDGGAPVSTAAFDGLDVGAYLLLIASTTVAFWARDDDAQRQVRNCVYAMLASSVTALAFASTLFFKFHALDTRIAFFYTPPCRSEGADGNWNCAAHIAFGAGWSIVTVSQAALAVLMGLGILMPPPPPMEF
jgi:hypothetical protein